MKVSELVPGDRFRIQYTTEVLHLLRHDGEHSYAEAKDGQMCFVRSEVECTRVEP